MAAVYILYSVSVDRFYIGSCNNLEERLKQHKEKVFSNSFTRRAEDWELYYSLEGLKYQQARKIETHIKLMRNRKYYENLKNHSELAEKLKLRYNNEQEEEQ